MKYVLEVVDGQIVIDPMEDACEHENVDFDRSTFTDDTALQWVVCTDCGAKKAFRYVFADETEWK